MLWTSGMTSHPPGVGGGAGLDGTGNVNIKPIKHWSNVAAQTQRASCTEARANENISKAAGTMTNSIFLFRNYVTNRKHECKAHREWGNSQFFPQSVFNSSVFFFLLSRTLCEEFPVPSQWFLNTSVFGEQGGLLLNAQPACVASIDCPLPLRVPHTFRGGLSWQQTCTPNPWGTIWIIALVTGLRAVIKWGRRKTPGQHLLMHPPPPHAFLYGDNSKGEQEGT